MSIERERKTIDRTKEPLTVTTLTQKLRACGVTEGQTVLVHLSMSQLGWVIGGAEAVILGLLGAVGETGTLMMVAHSNGNSDPKNWRNPPVPEQWWQTIRDNMPAYNRQTTPTRGVGDVPELFRHWPNTRRSDHPTFSMTAHGPNADFLTADHPLEDEVGDRSPLGKLYELDGHVLLLGVNHGNNTSLHLAESRADFAGKEYVTAGTSMFIDGKRTWVTFQSLDLDEEDFPKLGDDFDKAHNIQVQKINGAEVRLFRQRQAVDFGVTWLERHRVA